MVPPVSQAYVVVIDIPRVVSSVFGELGVKDRLSWGI